MNKPETGKRILRYLRPKLPLAVLALVFSAVHVALTLLIPIQAGKAIDLLIGEGRTPPDRLLPILTAIGGMALGAAAAQWVTDSVINVIAYSTVRDIRFDAFRRLQGLPLTYHDTHKTGDTVNRIINDTEKFSDGLLMGFNRLFSGAATILGTLILMLRLHKGITLIVVLLTPVSVFVARFISKRTYSMFQARSKAQGEQTAFIDEAINGAKVIKAYGTQAQQQKRFDEINEKLRKSSLRSTFFSSLTNPCTRFVNNLVYAGVALGGALLALSGSVTVGVLTCFLSYANQYTKPFNEISGVITEFQNAIACAGRVFELTDEPPEQPDSPSAVRLQAVKGDICCTAVDFSYTKGKRVLENISVNAKAGQHIAIVGPTGCGKTTFINLLMRFYDAERGSIRLDGQDIKAVTRKSLRESYGMVLQDTWLKAASVRDNIAFGKPGATQQQVEAAAKAAHAHGFITRLPNGYDTVLSENGAGLSQGQKQLICIARVMLCLPPMLILDEATSSIDTRTEQSIQRGFYTLMKGKTAFIVAHRLSTVTSADIILVMKDGRIIEQGTHTGLLSKGGFYSTLWFAGQNTAP